MNAGIVVIVSPPVGLSLFVRPLPDWSAMRCTAQGWLIAMIERLQIGFELAHMPRFDVLD
jgi:hypothetical protein